PFSVIFASRSSCLPLTPSRPGCRTCLPLRGSHRVGLVAGRTIAIGSAADLSAACWGSDRSRLFGQTFMAWRAFRRPATRKSAFRDRHVYDRNHDLRILTAML